MNKIKRREIELLTRKSKEHEIPYKLASDLLKTAKKLSYENHSPAARIKEYQDLIYFHTKNTN
ncbi:DNA modification system-associated small protein [Oceanobacillus kapialis]|uniref:DNA modification system-associated small protein n=1 Tax=Oceanobacillus kapialis TaxID=481353 RepID=UPI00384CB42E